MIAVAPLLAYGLDAVALLSAAGYSAGIAWLTRGIRPQPTAGDGTPRVSVVVAARDEEAQIGAALARLRTQDYPSERLEIIVVDDGSIDQTANVVSAACHEDPRILLLSTEAELGRSGAKKAALTLGVGRANGEIILTTDADCLVPPGWVRAMVAAFAPGVGLVCGFSQVGEPGGAASFRQRYEALDFLGLMGCILGSADHGRPMGASGQSLGYRREVFLEVGGYERVRDRASGDDVFLVQLVRRQTAWHIAFVTAPEAHVVHPWANSWRALLRQRTRWASNAPAQWHMDRRFFGLMVAAYTVNLALVLGPLTVALGAIDLGFLAAAGAAKAVAEWRLLRRAATVFGRRDLLPGFAAWALVQPLHVVVVGLLGCLGVFTWKGRRHRWGRQR
jgi:cellulose synthase/poly-beta-1,6-N-acetylglucosamine synthase-like glycosyltransferase